MGDFQFWLYVIIGIIYLLSRMRKKSQEQEQNAPGGEVNRPATRTHNQPERQLTFEELLREITEGKTVKTPERKPEPVVSRPVYKNYDEEIADEEEDLEDVDYDYRKQDSIYKQYEDAKSQAFIRPSLEETMDLSKTDMTFGKFKAFEIHRSRTGVPAYLDDLKDPEGLKKAFVMSEILKRKF
jgi:hypothetical protein